MRAGAGEDGGHHRRDEDRRPGRGARAGRRAARRRAWPTATAWPRIRNTNYYELGLRAPQGHAATAPPIYADPQWLDLLDSVDEHGCVDVPDGPGLGVELDWDFITAHKTGETVYE